MGTFFSLSSLFSIFFILSTLQVDLISKQAKLDYNKADDFSMVSDVIRFCEATVQYKLQYGFNVSRAEQTTMPCFKAQSRHNV